MKLDYLPILNENNVTKFVQICAWCDATKVVTDEYRDKGYRTSHGICHKHRNEVFRNSIKYHEKNSFSIDDSGTSESNRLQHDSGSFI